MGKGGIYNEAIASALRTLKIRRQILGKQDPAYATNLNNLALLYKGIGDYTRAEPLYEDALQFRRQAVGENHPDYATSLNNLAGLHSSMGDYPRAEPLYQKALQIHKQALGEKHLAYATDLNNLAELYRSVGDYARAEPLYQQAFQIHKQALGEKHPLCANDLSNLALLCMGMEDYARAEPFYQQALQIRKQDLGEKHPDYATSLNNLAELYRHKGDYARAEPLYQQASTIWKHVLGEKHPSYAASLNNLALLYQSMGDYALAEPLYQQASIICEQALGEKHPLYATSLNNLAELYQRMGDHARAEPLCRQALAITRQSLEATAAALSERQQLAMGQGLRHQLDSYVSLGLAANRYARGIYSNVLLWKGATLARQRGMRLAADDPVVSELFGQLQQVTRQWSSLSRMAPEIIEQRDSWRTRVADLTHQKERIEAELSTKSAAFRQATKEVTLKDLLAALPADTALVDFLEFARSAPPAKKSGKPTSQRQLVAFVVRSMENPADEVTMISLGAVAPVSEAIDTWRATYGDSAEGMAAGRELRAKLWEPLLATIGDAKTLLVSTDGVLGRLPLGALPGKRAGKYLLEDHRLAMLPVPQLLPALVNNAGNRELSRELLLLGDVDYNEAQDADATPANKMPPRRRPPSGKLFKSLANTAREIASIEKLFTHLFEVKSEVDPLSLVKRMASEARFRELAPRYRHLHLATHGFFAAPQYTSAYERAVLMGREAPLTGYDPGLLSGLALAGANRKPIADTDDGILFAQEIAMLQLSGVDTVVLSACDTGLGAVAGGEGLLGVQRAFQVAGARTTVASYWKVDDLVTRLLMERFYRNLWKQKMPRLDALREAQLFMLNYPDALRGVESPKEEVGVRTPPYYWAAFTLSGDWR